MVCKARGDIEAADVPPRNVKYAHACFHARQAAEKALKALWFYADAEFIQRIRQLKILKDWKRWEAILDANTDSNSKFGYLIANH